MLVINQWAKKDFATASTCSFVIGWSNALTQALSAADASPRQHA